MIQIDIKVQSNIDFDKLEKSIGSAVEKGTRQIVQQAYEEWQNIAGRKLKTTRRRYQDALSFTMTGDNSGEISLQAKDKNTQWLVSALEGGAEAFSIRDRVLAKAKTHWPRPMSPAQRKAMFAYLAEKGRLGERPTPFTDVPFRTSGAKQQGTPNAYRRISKNTPSEKWKHPGFRPKGSGGPGPLREEVIEYVKKTAKDVFIPLFARISV